MHSYEQVSVFRRVGRSNANVSENSIGSVSHTGGARDYVILHISTECESTYYDDLHDYPTLSSAGQSAARPTPALL